MNSTLGAALLGRPFQVAETMIKVKVIIQYYIKIYQASHHKVSISLSRSWNFPLNTGAVKAFEICAVFA